MCFLKAKRAGPAFVERNVDDSCNGEIWKAIRFKQPKQTE